MKKLFAILILSGAVALLFAEESSKRVAPIYQDASRLAIGGYDPVAYFNTAQPQRGLPKFEFAWMGATWHFGSAQNRDAFAAVPEKFAPPFGGVLCVGGQQQLHRSC